MVGHWFYWLDCGICAVYFGFPSGVLPVIWFSICSSVGFMFAFAICCYVIYDWIDLFGWVLCLVLVFVFVL